MLSPMRRITDSKVEYFIPTWKLSDHPVLRALVAQFCSSGDPVCFAAIYDYLVENIPEFLEVP